MIKKVYNFLSVFLNVRGDNMSAEYSESIGIKHSQVASSKKKKLFYFGLKRFFDILFSLFGIFVLVFVAIFTKIAFLVTKDTNSIFYTQQRIGKNGKVINIYKFRSMVCNSQEALEELLKEEKYRAEWDANHKLKNDPRITKVGKFLRKTSLDELPQFINVIKGDMSLIGPRPLVYGELDAHNGNHEIYESVRPGLSGWWAANGRSDTTYEKRLELEYYYCEHCSLWLDIKCIFRTIKAVFTKKGVE